MICKKCGAEIENGLMYCPKCGESIQLVPDYNVLEEELLSRVVEDKKKSKDDKFATGVYQNSTATQPIVDKPVDRAQPKKENQVFTKKIKIILFSACIVIAIIGVFLIIPYMGTHTYNNVMDMAVEAEDNQQYAKALGYYEEAYGMDNSSFEAVYGLGRMYFNVKDYNSAISMLKIALESDPTNKKIYTYLIDSYDALNDIDSIIELGQNAPTDEIKELFASYILQPPEFNIPGGEYSEDQLIQLTCEGDNKIVYTTNGKNPTISGKLYSKPITIKEGTTVIKAATQNSAGEYSDVVTMEYKIVNAELGLPVVSPEDGVYSELVSISVEVPDGCEAYYTWDGTDPSVSGTLYTGPFTMLEGASVLSVVLVDEEGNVGPIYRGDYVYQP